MKKIIDQKFDLERSLYSLKDCEVTNCFFLGPNDGESALKEARNIKVSNCNFSLRYPLWHVNLFSLTDSSFDELSRAPIWYSKNGTISNTKINSVKAIRECENISFDQCVIDSTEFGWKSSKIRLNDCHIFGEYIFFNSNDVRISNIKMKGKYSFQYMTNLVIENSELDTKDAFWHTKNATLKNCIIKGEYLGWYSEDLTFINCKIIGTQPLCYCKNLKLIDCEMVDCDFSFEYSDVNATIKGKIDSIKNVLSGTIEVDNVDEIINCDQVYPCSGKIIIKKNEN